MKVILNQDVKGLGKNLQTVEVSEGYARNFLFPKKLANPLEGKYINEANTKLDAIRFKKQQELEEANQMKKSIETGFIEIRHKVGDGLKLFGSITEKDISQEIQKKYQITIDKRKIVLDSPIKELGGYAVKIKLYEGIVANLKINVIKML